MRVVERHNDAARQRQGFASWNRGRGLGIETNPDKPATFRDSKGGGAVHGGKFRLAFEVGDVFQMAGCAIIGPAVVAALDHAIAQHTAQRQRRAAMRAAIFQRPHHALMVAP